MLLSLSIIINPINFLRYRDHLTILDTNQDFRLITLQYFGLLQRLKQQFPLNHLLIIPINMINILVIIRDILLQPIQREKEELVGR